MQWAIVVEFAVRAGVVAAIPANSFRLVVIIVVGERPLKLVRIQLAAIEFPMVRVIKE